MVSIIRSETDHRRSGYPPEFAKRRCDATWKVNHFTFASLCPSTKFSSDRVVRTRQGSFSWLGQPDDDQSATPAIGRRVAGAERLGAATCE